MKRRPFISGITAMGAGGLLALQSKASTLFTSNIQMKDAEPHNQYPNEPISVLVQLENMHLSFQWFSDASAILLDKKTNISWQMAPIALQEMEAIERDIVWVRNERFVQEQYLGKFFGRKASLNTIRFALFNEADTLMGSFTCKVDLIEDELIFSIADIDEKLPNLIFPTPLDSDKMVLPMGAGKLISKPIGNMYSRFFYPTVGALNMRFWGGMKGESSIMATIDQGYEDTGLMCLGTTASCVWQKSLQKWSGTKVIKYTFVSDGYVGMAKRYRTWAQKNGLVKTLSEKIKETPQLKNLIGGRMLSFYQARPKRSEKRNTKNIYQFKQGQDNNPKVDVDQTHKDILTLLEASKNAGLKKGILNVRGWIRGGYDYSHPDIWPPEPSLGTLEEFKKIVQLPDPFVTVLHDNYLDSYKQNPSWPKGVMTDSRGQLMKAGYWAGGQAYILDYKFSNIFARQNWEKIKSLQPRGMFIDTVTAQQFYQSYTPGNTSSKTDDRIYRSQCLEFYKNEKQIVGSEESADFGIPYVDWLENRHKRVAGESIPLWSLVFHDCVMNARYIDPSNVSEKGAFWLTDMLWGYFILYRMPKVSEWKSEVEQFKSSMPADQWFEQIATAEMLSHGFLSDDMEIEKTTFSNGKSIIVNFSQTERNIEGKVIPAQGYLISG